MDHKNLEKIASTRHTGLFQLNKMCFGLMNVSAIFQEFAIAYLDDILIFSATLEEHLDHMNQVFERLRQHPVKLKVIEYAFIQVI